MIDDLIAHLGEATASFVTIIHAQDQRPVDDVEQELPMLGVFPGDDSTSDDATDMLTSKMLTSVVQIHIVCPIEQLDALKAELRGAAMGWNAGPTYTDLALISGKLLDLKGGVAWWEERYANRHIIRATY